MIKKVKETHMNNTVVSYFMTNVSKRDMNEFRTNLKCCLQEQDMKISKKVSASNVLSPD